LTWGPRNDLFLGVFSPILFIEHGIIALRRDRTFLTLSLLAVIATTAPAASAQGPRTLTPDQRRILARCTVCHAIEVPNDRPSGPSLQGVVGRPIAARPGFAYSAALKKRGGRWDEATLDAFLASPAKLVPGNRMAFAGIKTPKDRAAVVAALKATGQ
jgi:cytochrome c